MELFKCILLITGCLLLITAAMYITQETLFVLEEKLNYSRRKFIYLRIMISGISIFAACRIAFQFMNPNATISWAQIWLNITMGIFLWWFAQAMAKVFNAPSVEVKLKQKFLKDFNLLLKPEEVIGKNRPELTIGKNGDIQSFENLTYGGHNYICLEQDSNVLLIFTSAMKDTNFEWNYIIDHHIHFNVSKGQLLIEYLENNEIQTKVITAACQQFILEKGITYRWKALTDASFVQRFQCVNKPFQTAYKK